MSLGPPLSHTAQSVGVQPVLELSKLGGEDLAEWVGKQGGELKGGTSVQWEMGMHEGVVEGRGGNNAAALTLSPVPPQRSHFTKIPHRRMRVLSWAASVLYAIRHLCTFALVSKPKNCTRLRSLLR